MVSRIAARLLEPWRRFRGDRRGSIAVEAGFAISGLLLMLLPLVDFGNYIGARLELKQALRAGAQCALYRSCLGVETFEVAVPQDYEDALDSYVQAATTLQNISFTVTSVTCRCLDGTTAICAGQSGYAVCASDDLAPGRFVTMQASVTMDPFFPFMPWYGANQSVMEQLTIRVQ